MADDAAGLRPILKNHAISPIIPQDSANYSNIGNSVETLDTDFNRLSASSEADVLKKSEEIIKRFELDKEFGKFASKNNDDPLYVKVKCPFPPEFDFSNDYDKDALLAERELRSEPHLSRLQFEGKKLRINLKKESKRAVKRSKVLNFINPAFVKRVSFDTVNKIVDENDANDEALRLSLMDDGGMGLRHGPVNPEDFSRGRTSLSPPRGMEEPSTVVRTKSPSRNSYGQSRIIDIDSSVVTRLHRDFESIYDDKESTTRPVLPGRTIMVYISGRKHTWVALDWLFRAFLENGDTVVVVATVNPIHAHFRAKSADRSQWGARSPMSTSRRQRSQERAKKKNSPEHVREVTLRIMKYCLALADPDLIVKIVVELSLGTTREVIRNMYELYKPTLLVTSAKRRIETFPAVAWRSSKIGDKLVSSYIVPVILVPAANMDLFEFSLFLQLRLKFSNLKPDLKLSQKFQKTKLNSLELYSMMNALKLGSSLTAELLKSADDEDEVKDVECVESDVSSIDSVESDNDLVKSFSGTSSILGLRETCERIEKELEIQLRKEDKTSPNYYKNLLTYVTDASRQIGICMAEIEREDGAGASLIRTITGAPSSKKYRSLLDIGESKPITKMKTVDYAGSASRKPIPKVKIDDQTSPIRPVQSSLKFDINTPKKEMLQRYNSRKSFSDTTNTKKPQLYPMKSSPQISGGDHIHADAEKEKMRKNKFSSFFKFHRK